jgi:cyanate permease
LSDKLSQAELSEAIKEQNEKVWTISSAWHTRTLWNLVLIQVVVAICFQTIMIHIVAAAIDVGIVPEAAALILTVSGVTNTTGRLLVSSLAGRIGNKVVLVICLAAQRLYLLSA